jgi:ATP-binding cassette, subfamily C, bacterial LapB
MMDNQQGWDTLSYEELPHGDSLLACLVVLSRYYKHPKSANSLSARLPLQKNRLTLDLIPRAAKRANLEANLDELTMDTITPSMLPMIVMDKSGEAHLLISLDNETIKVIDFSNPEAYIDFDSIKGNCTNQIIRVEPIYQYSDRSTETLGKEKRNWFWPIFLSSWPIYIEVLIASFLISLFAVVMPLFIMNVYDRVVPNNAIDTLWVLSTGIFVVFFFDFILKSLRSYFIDWANKKTDSELSTKIFSHVMGIRMIERPKSVGSMANIVQSYELFRDFITSGTITILIDIPFVFIFIFVIYMIGGPLFWVPILVIPLILFFGFVFQIPLVVLTKKSYKLAAEKQSILFESLHNIETVKTTNSESNLQSRWEEVARLSIANSSRIKQLSTLSVNIAVFFQQLATVFIVIWGVYLIAQNEITLGALIAATILSGRAVAPMTQVANLLTRYYQSTNALKGIDRLMQLNTDTVDETSYLHRPKIEGNIEFNEVTFEYGEDKTPILKNINLSIQKGEKVAIIGRVGSGKSTLARLLLHLYEPTSGKVLIDGTDYKQINPDDLRHHIGYVCQDVSLFYGSIRDNITVSTPFVDDAQLIDVCNLTGIGQFTNKHPMGIDRPVGERGLELSGGQRQCVAIARALILEPRIIIFDEPTSSMDDNTERLFKKRFKQYLTPDHTLLIITHKFSMLELVDRVVVLDDGRIVADGPKNSVISALKAGMPLEKDKEDN